MSDPIISVNQLVKVYKMGDMEVYALRGVTLDIGPGDFVAIMGKSGSGKSTFMNIVGCLDIPTKGDYKLDGVDITTLSKDQLAKLRNQKIGFVFQSYNLLPRTTALENVELPLMYDQAVSSKEMKNRALQALEIVGLADRATHVPSQLSGGEQQRVAIARALINNPRVILADEPTGNLDTRTSVEILGVFQQLNRQGITVVIVTHEADIALFTKRNIHFRDGRITKSVEVTRRKHAEEELRNLPVLTDEEEEG
ncbi:MAG: ABC transporter ATP-binding protein [bacterium]